MPQLHTVLAFGPLGTPELIVILLLWAVLALLFTLPFWFICKKAGLSPWLSVLSLVPFGTVILLFIIAFVDWPALKQTSAPQN